MNDILNNKIPRFRCSDETVVKLYYFLWSLHMMYYKQGANQGMQIQPHTQTAVNNFLGMHRYDAVFQILVGSWVAPEFHDLYANGNVLAWRDVLQYRQGDMLPDNFGIDWVSGVYGSSAIAHIIGAWQIYEHSGNRTFLQQAYEFYKDLYWDNIGGKHFGYAYDSVLCLNKMADVLGYPEDAIHWNETVGMHNVHQWLENEWEKDTIGVFGSTANGVSWSNIASSGISMFPRDWVEIMANEWMDDSVKGFYGDVPLTTIALQDFDSQDIVNSFAVVPDSNWYMIRGLYMHNIDRLANKFTLAHLKKYNMEWGIPVAPEGRHKDFSLFGDQYSNFNGGKILLLLEGMFGIRYSVEDDTFTFADNLPTEWSFMELEIPVKKPGDDNQTTWVKLRAERIETADDEVVKVISVDGNPFNILEIQPWREERDLVSVSPEENLDSNPPPGHTGWIFEATTSKTVTLTLR